LNDTESIASLDEFELVAEAEPWLRAEMSTGCTVWHAASRGPGILKDALQRTAARLSDREWWQPLIQPTCSRCGKPVEIGDRRIIDGCGPVVTITHLWCLVDPRTPHIRPAEQAAEPWYDYAPWERTADLMAWSVAVRRSCARARALGDQALDEIEKLLTMLNRARRGCIPQ
jgi:hypothetical protein